MKEHVARKATGQRVYVSFHKNFLLSVQNAIYIPVYISAAYFACYLKKKLCNVIGSNCSRNLDTKWFYDFLRKNRVELDNVFKFQRDKFLQRNSLKFSRSTFEKFTIQIYLLKIHLLKIEFARCIN